MPFTDSDLKWFAARLSIAIHETNREYSMGIGGDLKARLGAIPGIEEATSDIEGGQRVFKISGKTIAVGRFAFDNEIERAIRKAFGMSDEIHTTELPAAPLIVAVPEPVAEAPKPVELAVPPAPAPKPQGSFAASLRVMMDEARAGVAQARADGLAKVTDAISKLTEARTATIRVTGSMAQTIEDEAASVMAELGQISNDLRD
jgi:hypothetical protein